MDKDGIKDKSNFVIALVAAVLALGPFRTDLASVVILSIDKTHINLLDALTLFLIFLAVSAYFYAVNYANLNFWPIFERYKNIVAQFLAWFFYLLALITPLVVALLWVLSLIDTPENLMTATVEVSAVLSALISLFYSRNKEQQLKRELKVRIEILREELIKQSESSYNNSAYAASILELYKVVESTMRSRLDMFGYRAKDWSDHKLAIEVMRNRLLSEEQQDLLKHLKDLRNQVVHFGTPITKENADEARKLTKSIIEALNSYKR